MAALSVTEPEPTVPPPPPPPAPPAAAAVRKGQGVCAIVVYEYEAAEENELALVEGELIEQIEQIDEGIYVCLLARCYFIENFSRMVVWCWTWWQIRSFSM